MELDKYREQFLEDLRFRAEHYQTDPEAQFIDKMLEDLVDMGELPDAMPMSVEKRGRRGRIMAFDAYAYDEADGALIMIISDFSNQKDNLETLTNTRISELYNHMVNFIDESVNGSISDYFDDSDPAINVAKEIRKNIGKSLEQSDIVRFKFYILSDSVLSKSVKSITQEDFLERPSELSIWTIDRIYQTFASNSSEIIEFDTKDFGCNGIPCIKAELGNDAAYDAYLGIIPGKFLADIYIKYGSKLLQGNVRAFLSVRGKINKGIRETIIKHQESFFTYNNGIAIVARGVKFSPDGSKIIYFKDPQIINGGQTTASLANAIIKKEVAHKMENLFVPMKLTVLNVADDMSEEEIEQYNSITKKISECANSQNAVKDADFFSNHPFHIMMEKLSKKVMAPPVNGKPYQTIWFYERSRGKWEQEQMKLTPAQKIKFCEMHPKAQVIKKETLAKCLNSVYMNPHQVCQSSAINFKYFAEIIEAKYNDQRDTINEEFFKKCVCSVIIFDNLDLMISKAPWYPKGGNKAQIVPYTIARLFTLIPSNKDIDWKYIWQKQTLYPALADELMRIAYITHKFLLNIADGGLVRSISRTQNTWTEYKKSDVRLSDAFVGSLVSKEETREVENSAKRAHKFNADIDASVEIFNLGAPYWMDVYNKLSKAHYLPWGELDFVRSMAMIIQRNNLLTPAQCKRLIKIIEKAEDKGFIMP